MSFVKYGCLDVSSQPPSYEDKLPYEIWGWEVQLNITWTLLLLLITIIKDYCLQEDNCGNTMVLNNHIHEGIYIVPFKSLGLVRFYAFWKSLLLLETHDANNIVKYYYNSKNYFSCSFLSFILVITKLNFQQKHVSTLETFKAPSAQTQICWLGQSHWCS